MKKVKLIIALIAVSAVFLSGTAFAIGKATAVDLSSVNNANELKADVQDKSFQTLIRDLNAAGDDISSVAAGIYAQALAEKTAVLSAEKITTEILNESNTDFTRSILMEILPDIGFDKIDRDKIRTLINKNSSSEEIKINALYLLELIGDSETLESVAVETDGDAAFYALKYLNWIDKDKAERITVDVLKDFDGVVTEKIRAAILLRGGQLNEYSSKEERDAFITFCDSILEKTSSDDDIVCTIELALSEMVCEESISYILSSDKIADCVKSTVVETNLLVLTQMAESEPSEKRIRTLLTAMEMCPMAEMHENLMRTLSENESFFSLHPELEKEMTAMLATLCARSEAYRAEY